MPHQFPGQDPFNIPKKKPGREYRWLADDRDRMNEHLIGAGDRPGWKLVRGNTVPSTRELCVALGLPESYVDETVNMIKYGRLILADIPATEAKKRRQDLRQEGIDKREAQVDEFNDKFAGRKGVNAAIREMAEFEDRKKFATEEKVSVSMAGLDIPTSSNQDTV